MLLSREAVAYIGGAAARGVSRRLICLGAFSQGPRTTHLSRLLGGARSAGTHATASRRWSTQSGVLAFACNAGRDDTERKTLARDDERASSPMLSLLPQCAGSGRDVRRKSGTRIPVPFSVPQASQTQV
jgi:hypothetical protein